MRIHLEVGVAWDWRPLRPDTDMMGGTEILALRLSSLLAAAGHEVTFRGGGEAGMWNGVRLLGDREEPPDCDALICVQAEAPPMAAARRIYWSHAAQLPRTAVWDAIVAVSPYHAEILRERLLGVEIVAIRPGVDLPELGSVPPDRFLYASSPDRGLHRLLSMWPALWERFHLPLSVTYDVRAVIRRHGERPDALGERLRWVAKMISLPGVILHGPLGSANLARLRSRSAALLYPLDPVLPHSELASLSVLEACAAGVPPVLSPVDCFPSEYGSVARLVEPGGAVYEEGAWLGAVEDVLDDRRTWSEKARVFANTRTWGAFRDHWERLLQEIVGRPTSREEVSRNESWLIVESGILPGDKTLAGWLTEAARKRGHHLTVVAASELGSDEDALRAASGVHRILLVASTPGSETLRRLRRVRPSASIVFVAGLLPLQLSSNTTLEDVDLVILGLPPEALHRALDEPDPLVDLPAGLMARIRCVGPLPPAIQRQADRSDPGTIAILEDVGLEMRSVAEQIARNLGIPLKVVDAEGLASALTNARLVISRPRSDTTGLSLAAGTPLLLVTRPEIFGVQDRALRHPMALADGSVAAQVLLRAGLADVTTEDLHPSVLARAVRAALRIRPVGLGGGAERAVRWIEDLPNRSSHSPIWRPLELRS